MWCVSEEETNDRSWLSSRRKNKPSPKYKKAGWLPVQCLGIFSKVKGYTVWLSYSCSHGNPVSQKQWPLALQLPLKHPIKENQTEVNQCRILHAWSLPVSLQSWLFYISVIKPFRHHVGFSWLAANLTFPCKTFAAAPLLQTHSHTNQGQLHVQHLLHGLLSESMHCFKNATAPARENNCMKKWQGIVLIKGILQSRPW